MKRRTFIHAGGAALAGLWVRPGGSRAAIASGRAAIEKGRAADWELSNEFISVLPDLLRRAEVPGMSAGLAGAGDDVRTVVAGRREAGGDADVTPDTVFAAGSLSKPVLATIALGLHSSGAFDVDRPLVEYLDTDIPTGPGSELITSRHALQHTTGLANWRFTSSTPFAISGPPGGAWRYSGEGFVLVQRALEGSTGRGLESLAREHVFGPLGMSSTTFIWRRDLADRTATPYVPPDDRFADYADLFRWKERALVEWAESDGRDPADVTLDDARTGDESISSLAAEMAGRSFPETDPLPNFLSPNGAGSLKTTAADYARLLQRWLTDDALGRAAFAAPVAHPGGLRWGLGWGMEPAGASFWHWGESLGVRTLAFADPAAGDAGEVLTVLSNGDRGMQIAEAVFIEATGARSPIFDAI